MVDVLTLKRAIRVRGVVREKGTEKPIAGVQVAVAIAESGAMTTGQDGSYEGYVPKSRVLRFEMSMAAVNGLGRDRAEGAQQAVAQWRARCPVLLR